MLFNKNLFINKKRSIFECKNKLNNKKYFAIKHRLNNIIKLLTHGLEFKNFLTNSQIIQVVFISIQLMEFILE